MARILSIDYGTKRSGLAVTDPLQIIASPLEAVATKDLLDFVRDYCEQEEVEQFVIGYPTHADGTPTYVVPHIVGFKRKLEKLFPDKTVHFQDERFTSADARAVILQSGAKQKKRRDKSLIDKVSAVLILQDFLGHLED
ncbi:MAG: Holliday junction resolvase RuvX [Bacteroidota bacterium]